MEREEREQEDAPLREEDVTAADRLDDRVLTEAELAEPGEPFPDLRRARDSQARP